MCRPPVAPQRDTWNRCKAAEEPPTEPGKHGGEMKHETSRALYHYWLGCHRGAGVRAGAVRASDLASLLPSLFLIDLEKADAPTFRFRFCGASIATRYGSDLTDESFLALWNPADAASMKRDLRAVAFRTTGMVCGLITETVGGGAVAMEMLLLPLAGENGTAGAIGSMERTGGHDETNRIRARVVSQSLRSIRFLPDVRTGFARTDRDGTAALPSAAFQNPRRYGHLTVVSGGKQSPADRHLLTDL